MVYISSMQAGLIVESELHPEKASKATEVIETKPEELKKSLLINLEGLLSGCSDFSQFDIILATYAASLRTFPEKNSESTKKVYPNVSLENIKHPEL